ncbi:hypothetical protein B7R54_11690 [Subtercola boreus]|uniref:HTH araC/xylS-type domain-containing protein n=1 Tax=Subtercola boreus TaxID=120213 RepID=A0A3E0VIL6_9MICO|nr:hypothetical protein [Subtercola boreus]RFA09792.1 hypothetical protein B7R54_11690 [Subtercola boreus]TQL53091.1 AraC-like protein [Subtercola boreus]
MRRSIRVAITSPSSARGTVWSFGGVDVVDVVQQPTAPIPLFGPRPGISPHPRFDERVAVIALVDGDVTVAHDGNLLRFASGSAAFAASNATTTVEISEPCRALAVSMPRSWLRAAGVEVHDSFGAFAYSTAQSSPLMSFLLALIEILDEQSLPCEPTATVLTGLVSRLFLADNAYSLGAHQPDLDVRALADSLIALGSSDSGYGAKTLAAQLQMSPAELERTFSVTGDRGNAGSAITERRMAMAMLGLQATGLEVSSLKEIARHAGFSGEHELHRALKTVYGTTVKAVLLAQSEEAATSRAGFSLNRTA